ncbi:MAG: 1-acyl-sn-glycerol-3-phosphate acyltransferase [Muribaculaceae bacterium]|nr:1-acyl-sn-glycerol-3-phosphate acyltransferase [Muribaculaceae bacterium]
MNIWGSILRILGWSVEITAPRRNKCVICVAPHTSNLDFLMGLMAYKSLGREANFLMKSFWFFFPLGYIIRGLGGIPVYRDKSRQSLTSRVIKQFKEREYMNLAVTPEGTRSAVADWHTGFLRIALGAGVPLQLGIIDYSAKKIIIRDEFMPGDDIEADMRRVKMYYSNYKNAAKYPEKFLT